MKYFLGQDSVPYGSIFPDLAPEREDSLLSQPMQYQSTRSSQCPLGLVICGTHLELGCAPSVLSSAHKFLEHCLLDK